jgi:hypothetical protein
MAKTNVTSRTETLETIHNEIDEAGYNPTVYHIYDNDDLIDFALSFLLSNLGDAFGETVWCSDHDGPLADCPEWEDGID